MKRPRLRQNLIITVGITVLTLTTFIALDAYYPNWGATAELILKYVQALVWPAVVVLALIIYHDAILAALTSVPKVKISLFGVEFEITLPELEESLTAAVGDVLEDKQWDLLEQIEQSGQLSVTEKNLNLRSMDGHLRWVRPIRNAGIIKTLPEGEYIESAEYLVLTPLGKLLMKARKEQRQDKKS